jgi:signal transduction histidine kinase/CheY-like chemotaxis protein/ligand-binding sensor domain-containing protein
MRRPVPSLILCTLVAAAAFASAARPGRAGAPDVLSVGRDAVRVFTDKDGLPQNGITSLAFDRSSYLWAGTKDGAAYYNGREWLTARLPAGIGSTWITRIVVDSAGVMWFGTLGGGVARFDGANWSVVDERDGLPNPEVKDIAEGAGGVLYVATNDGVARFDGARWTVLPPMGRGRAMSTVNRLHVSTGAAGRDVLWAGLDDAGVGRFEDGAWTVYTTASGLPDNRVSDFVETAALDGRSALVVATFGGGLARFDGDRWTAYAGDRATPNALVQCLHETTEKDGTPALWAGTSRGLAKFERGRWVTESDVLDLPVPGIWSLLDTPSPRGSRTLWIGTSGGGLARWEQGRWVAITKDAGLPDSSVYGMLETTNRAGDPVYWVGTITGGLAKYEAGRWTDLNAGTRLHVDTPGVLEKTVARDGSVTVWVGTSSTGLVLLRDGRAPRFVGRGQGLPNMRVTCVMPVDGDAEEALVGTLNGLVRVRGGRVFAVDPRLALPDPRVRCLLETASPDGGRTLWVGTEHGLARFERGETTVYDASSGLVNNVVISLLEVTTSGGGRELWAGTRSGGVSRLDLSPSGEWAPLTSQTLPALPNDTVYQMRQDAAGRVYVFTNKGVARLAPRRPTDADPSPFAVYTFTTEDGLPSNECNTGASMIDGRGRIWAGTIGGAAVFDPSAEIEDVTPKPLVVDRAAIADTLASVVPGAWLDHDQNHLLFEYSLLSYFRESDTRYRTQLVGLDPHPSEWSADPKKEYTSLPAGDYVFTVWARDAAGNLTGPVAIPFHVRPAPWATWWAFVLYALATAAIVYLAVRLRIRSLRRRNLALETRIAERTAELASKVEALRVSEQRAVEAKGAAVASERRAIEASRAKSVFLANMSHELRTPLNAILGFVQLMERDRDVSGEQRENLGVIMRSGEHLLALINDVLSISKIEAGRATLDPAPFDLRHVLRVLEEMFRLRAESKGLRFVVDLDESVPRFVLGDEAKLRQVLINLLGNAVKFTERGEVALHAEWVDGRALFTVRDTGPGMSADELGRLFEAFVQTQSGARSQEGTGLGLAISRDFATLMDGDIAVESDEGIGTTFRVHVALPQAGDVPPTPSLSRVVGLEDDQPRTHALVVDDVPENRILLRKLLSAVGFEVTEASNGREAVELWAERRPDVVLMDVRMPVLDGIEATREIRRLEAADGREGVARSVVIALTASAFEHDRTAILAAGCDAYVPKPFREGVVFEKLAEHAKIRFRYQPPDAAAVAAAGAGASGTAGALTTERLATIAPDLVSSLSDAVAIGDIAAAIGATDRIREADSAVGSELHALVRAYQFDAIMDLLAGGR